MKNSRPHLRTAENENSSGNNGRVRDNRHAVCADSLGGRCAGGLFSPVIGNEFIQIRTFVFVRAARRVRGRGQRIRGKTGVWFHCTSEEDTGRDTLVKLSEDVKKKN